MSKILLLILVFVLPFLTACNKKKTTTPTNTNQGSQMPKEPCEQNNTCVLQIHNQQNYRFELYLNNNYIGLQAKNAITNWTIPQGAYTIRLEQYEGFVGNPIIVNTTQNILQCDTSLVSM